MLSLPDSSALVDESLAVWVGWFDHFLQGERLQELLVGAGYEVWLSTSILELESDLEIGLFSQDSVLDNSQPDFLLGVEFAHGITLTGLNMTFLLSTAHFSQEFPGCESLIRFQMKADEAGVVVFIVSKAFVKSKTCQQQVRWHGPFSRWACNDDFFFVWQVFYCEHRKRILCVRTGDFFMPGWMSMLIGTRPFEVRFSALEGLLWGIVFPIHWVVCVHRMCKQMALRALFWIELNLDSLLRWMQNMWMWRMRWLCAPRSGLSSFVLFVFVDWLCEPWICRWEGWRNNFQSRSLYTLLAAPLSIMLGQKPFASEAHFGFHS